MKLFKYGVFVAFLLCIQCSQMIFSMKSKNAYDGLILKPMNLYNSGMRNYLSGNYWDASFFWAELLTKCPDFFLNDKATYYLGNCYRYLGLNDISNITLNDTIKGFGKYHFFSHNIFGLAVLNFIGHKYDSTLIKCEIVDSDSTNNEIKPSALFLSALTYFNLDRFSECAKSLNNMSNTVPVKPALTDAMKKIVGSPIFIHYNSEDSLSTSRNKLSIIFKTGIFDHVYLTTSTQAESICNDIDSLRNQFHSTEMKIRENAFSCPCSERLLSERKVLHNEFKKYFETFEKRWNAINPALELTSGALRDEKITNFIESCSKNH
jgi:hypothetical protein